jgi:hypothetical protein
MLLSLLSTSALANDYACQSRHVRINLKVKRDISIVIKDTYTNDLIFMGNATEKERDEAITNLYFDTMGNSPLQLRFKTSALENQEEKLFGFAKGWTGAGIIDDSLVCLRKNQ